MSEEERVAHLPERWAMSSLQRRDDCIPSVIPADAGIHVASPVSVHPRVGVQAHFTSSLPSFRRTPESTSPPGVCTPASWRTGTLYVIPSVIPADAGIHVAPRCLYTRELAYRHTLRHPFRHSGGRRNPRRLPGVSMPGVGGTLEAGQCLVYWREWASAISGVARRLS